MINFRYHLVSLAAVFLALAVGVIIGYGVLDQPTRDFLQDRINTVEANAEQRRQENEQLRTEVEQLDASINATAPFAVTDRLTDVPLLVLAVRGVDEDMVKRSIDLARRGRADAPGVLWLESKWALSDPADTQALAEIVGAADDTRSQVREQGWQALAGRLANGPFVGTDLLRSLVDAGFVTFEGVGDPGNVALADLGGRAARALLMVGTDGEVPARFVSEPFARAAVTDQLPLVTAELFRAEEGEAGRGALVAPIRGDEQLAPAVSTVDDLDQPSGVVVTLLAAADLGRGVVGHYGFGEGATAAAPEWWQT